jgi:hypothetical protein
MLCFSGWVIEGGGLVCAGAGSRQASPSSLLRCEIPEECSCPSSLLKSKIPQNSLLTYYIILA